MAGVLYFSPRSRPSMEILQELHRTQNRDFVFVNVDDPIERRKMPRAVIGVPMALLPDGRALSGDSLFRVVFAARSQPAQPMEPQAVGADGFGAFLEGDAAEDDPQSSLEGFFARVETPKEDPVEDKRVSLDALQASRNNDIKAFQ
jgi:hypothetical protein